MVSGGGGADDDAGPTVPELVGESELGLALLLPGPAGTRVRWAHTTELVDPSAYLRGGELVCTVGQSLVDGVACASFAAAVAGAGAAGVCFGTGDVHPEVPGALVAACTDLGLALLEAGPGTPFMAVTEHLAALRVRSAVADGRAGQLLELLTDGALAPEALLPALVDAGLGRGQLRASAWPTSTVRELAAAVAGAPHLMATEGEVVLLVTADDLDLTAVAAALDVPWGTATPSPWRELGAGLRRARAELAAAAAVRADGEAGAVRGRATLAALVAAQPPEVLTPFVDALLRPLLDADRRRDAGLVDTLRAFLAADGSLVAVARAQYLHVNSVRHRLTRIRELTGTDPTTLDGAAAFSVALLATQRRP
ncbi:PucR C-terminal helix-turn-helix domain-containing protein [Quadrisphaera granulorum]|uniref:PucR-like helix-turn-helix protein n=1 Tax=Quadrisphaera granulorum TaxID=317664 RepID=A0A315ZSY5_9ACTN|nr:PucR family transcriptional regulator [Quadrisphaera granulorum]PWJ48671.1 PucR-like helix-turn-helix protein [Quadrisphaera granulorum]SZE98393.1 PucR C-terminal helix-turn-helix domain-containing protein [Quadrisphaera granulorum]